MTISNDHLLCPSCGGETNTTDRAGEAQNCRDCWLKTLYEPFKFPPCDVCGKGDETRTGQIHGEHLCDDCAHRKYNHLPYDCNPLAHSVAAA